MVIGLSGVQFGPSVIVRVITKLDDRAAGVRRLFITIMITDRIGRHEVLLPINYKNYNSEKKRIASYGYIKQLTKKT